MRTQTIAEQLEAFGRSLAQDVSPLAAIDRGEDHCPAGELFLTSRDAIRVQELNESIAQETR